ncbi:hypothetical protein ElyMa_001571900 [Elysia marginata]|uniref:Secreted protein n=1 Tax=Elysia marginata TaxID=1093978 RepID=A0AAV4JGA4_9GAST|nr:hypothetical protein ElyMa_001571900 [Elysia marginata]
MMMMMMMMMMMIMVVVVVVVVWCGGGGVLVVKTMVEGIVLRKDCRRQNATLDAILLIRKSSSQTSVECREDDRSRLALNAFDFEASPDKRQANNFCFWKKRMFDIWVLGMPENLFVMIQHE